MSELTHELNKYLSRNESKETLLPMTIQDIQLPKLSVWFNRNGSNKDDSNVVPKPSENGSSWFSFAEKDPCFPSLSHRQRILFFIMSIIMGTICFSLAAMYAPFLLIKSRKFSLLFTLGSLFSILSFSFLWGPVNHIKYMLSSHRILFTSVYFVSLFATLYFALSLQSTILTAVAAVVQIMSLFFFVISNIPGGQTGIKFMSSICSSLLRRTASRVLPV